MASLCSSSTKPEEDESVSSVEQKLQQLHQHAQDDIDLSTVVCLADFEHLARQCLDIATFNYMHAGADEEITRNLNHKMIVDKYYLRPSYFRDVSKIDTTKRIFGDKLDMPIGIAPTRLQKAFNSRGELATVRAASNQNALMILSQFSTTSLEVVAKEAPISTKWQQIYLIKNKDHMLNIINRAIRYGYRALVVSCDSPVLGHRRKTIVNKMPLEAEFNEFPVLIDPNIHSKFNKHLPIEWDDTRTWQDLADLKKSLGDTIRIIVKGILTPEDADCAIKAGVDGIYVSNSAGTQLDCCQTTIEALPGIVKIVRKRVPVFVDGGFETGNDVMKALALGADMVFLGRPFLYSLAVKGEQGVEHALKLINEELKRCMLHCGCKNLNEITSDIIIVRN